ncbi:hypothetical protein HJ50_19440 [Salmonella enterica subsp. enterica serovar Muenchen]|nr:hypothetical protein [Salmonella enterica subsp. enterica serovar Muenchen]
MGTTGDPLHVMHPVAAGLQFAVALIHLHKHGVRPDNLGDNQTSGETFPAMRATVRMTKSDTLRVGVSRQQILLGSGQVW